MAFLFSTGPVGVDLLAGWHVVFGEPLLDHNWIPVLVVAHFSLVTLGSIGGLHRFGLSGNRVTLAHLQ